MSNKKLISLIFFTIIIYLIGNIRLIWDIGGNIYEANKYIKITNIKHDLNDIFIVTNNKCTTTAYTYYIEPLIKKPADSKDEDKECVEISKKPIDDWSIFPIISNKDSALNDNIADTRKLFPYAEEYTITSNNDTDLTGSSSGLITYLYIYTTIMKDKEKQDLLKNRKIAGTGTLTYSKNDAGIAVGKIGSVGAIPAKTAAALKANVSIFFVPIGKNCTQAKEIAEKEKKSHIIHCVENVNQVIDILTK